MRTHAVTAIFRRNLVSYFSSPIGYVFICAFVLLSAAAAFWPNEFFNANLANLDQLNEKLPLIMLVFIPAVTMSIWADERRQGTDELLLTLPASDFEVVIGKYLAAVAIFAISLLFSLSNIFVLTGLGDPDLGLLLTNYVGYLLIGCAMISIGMVASFLTSNLTVGFVLAAAFNVPLIFAGSADAIVPWDEAARFIKSFGFAAQFEDFGRGLVSFASIVYFAGIIVVMLYLCMVLIGRRHWTARSEAGPVPAPMSAHYGLRTICLLVIAVGLSLAAHRFDLRADFTSERLSSVSPETEDLLAKLDPERPVFIEAYISPDVPQGFVQTRLNLITMLRQVDVLGGDGVIVRINDTDRFSEAASEAQEQFGITARQVPATTGGKISIEEIHLGVAFLSGLDKVVVPFFDRGIPVEYEIIRSIATVSQQQRKRIGVLATDAKLFGGFDMQSMSQRPDQPIVAELRKQYDVVPVDPSSEITETYDVLLAVQPSSLPQPQLENFIRCVRRGQPTAIFEDPMPFLDASVPGTGQPRRPASRNPFQQQPPPEPKGDINALWSMLAVDFVHTQVVWDAYNPYPKMEGLYPEFVFVSPGGGADEPFALDSVVTENLQQVLLLFSGSLRSRPGSSLTFTPLLRSGTESGYVAFDDILRRGIFGMTSLNPQRRLVPTRESFVLAARIQGEVVAEDDPAPPPADGEDEPPMSHTIDVVLAADLDMLQSAFFAVRAAGRGAGGPVAFDFDNVTYVLNLLDVLAGDERFVPIRSRRPRHRTLTAVERRTEVARTAADDERRRFLDAFEEQRTAEEAKLQEEIARLQQREGIDAREMSLEVSMKTEVGQNRLEARIAELERERDQEVERIERDLAIEVRRVQNTYKLAAVGLPPIPPLIVAFIVALRRRRLERIGVPRSRMRGGGGGAAGGAGKGDSNGGSDR
ncbi:MAG: ABC transporter permease subunit [Planctomycetes bacterium]|nr:ABC transporter permease subunit [Planctomycetota bacterium]